MEVNRTCPYCNKDKGILQEQSNSYGLRFIFCGDLECYWKAIASRPGQVDGWKLNKKNLKSEGLTNEQIIGIIEIHERYKKEWAETLQRATT